VAGKRSIGPNCGEFTGKIDTSLGSFLQGETSTESFAFNSFPIFYNPSLTPVDGEKKPAGFLIGGFGKCVWVFRSRLFLPGALLVAIRFEAFSAFVFRHLQTSFLLKISHGERVCEGSTCKPAGIV
jgi:hypothetical protein